MADTVINNAVSATNAQISGPYLLASPDEDTVYQYFSNGSGSLVVYKSTDGGSSFSSLATVASATNIVSSIWADWWTSGNTGTRIHCWWLDQDSDDLFYNFLDTSDDSQGTPVNITNQATHILGGKMSGCRTRGGNLLVAASGADAGVFAWSAIYRSTDNGANWSARADPWSGEASGDMVLMLPGNYADDEDADIFFWDVSADEISLKTYDDSGNSISETSISGSMVDSGPSTMHPQMAAAVRWSDGHAIFAAWNGTDVANADLKVWDINGGSSITALTDVLTNVTDDCGGVALSIDQNTDDLYVWQFGLADGSEAITATVTVRRNVSTDNGSTWSGQQAYSEDAADDLRSLWADHGSTNFRLGASWFNDDLNDIFYGFTNSEEITAPAPGGTAIKDIIGGGFILFPR